MTPTCVQCGKTGHLSRDCQNAPLPLEEQNKLREKYLRPGPRPSNSGVAAMVEDLSIEELGIHEIPTDPAGTMRLSVAMVEEWSGVPHGNPHNSHKVGDVGVIQKKMMRMRRFYESLL